MTRMLKFGGSSVADAACMRQVADVVGDALAQASNGGPVVVLSAMGKTTDALLRCARTAVGGQLEVALDELRAIEQRHRDAAAALFDSSPPRELAATLDTYFADLDRILRGVGLLGELSARSLDAIAAHGELLSTALFAAFLARRGIDARWVDARSVMRTDAQFGAALPQMAAIRELCTEHIGRSLAPGRVIVTQGFIGATADGVTTTLGRGGSDYSASLIGAALACDEVQIWTDVEGVFTSDPRIVPGAQPIAELSFAEAAELAAFGAKVLHPATIQPAVEARIPVTVRHTQRPHGRFTTIREKVSASRQVIALASRGPVSVVTASSTRMLAASGFLARLFDVFARLDVSVDLVATAEVSVSLTVENDAPLGALRRELEHFANVEITSGRSIVALVGERLKQTPGITGRALAALDELNVEMISMGANEINLSLVVDGRDEHEAVRRLHAALFEKR
jgi:aspartate kinase